MSNFKNNTTSAVHVRVTDGALHSIKPGEVSKDIELSDNAQNKALLVSNVLTEVKAAEKVEALPDVGTRPQGGAPRDVS